MMELLLKVTDEIGEFCNPFLHSKVMDGQCLAAWVNYCYFDALLIL